MSHCVYWIRDKSHTDLMTQGYVGVSGNVEKRFASHKGMWRGTNAHLRHAIKKYGWDSLEKSVLLIADKDYCLEIERKLRSLEKTGWNLTVGGGFPPTLTGPQPKLRGRAAWNKGRKGACSPETLAKMREAKLGKSPANKGIPLSDEHKAKLSAASIGRESPMKGKHHTPETVEKMRIAKLGKKISDETKKKMSEAQRKRSPRARLTEERKRKLGLLAKGKRWYNNGQNCVFCFEGQQPDGYVVGRGSRKFVKES